MTSFLSRTKLIVLAVQRRGYAGASHGSLSAGLGRGGSRSSMVGKKVEEESSSAWAPDPRTGYYRPANHGDEIDPAELREMLLKQRTNR